MGDLEEIKEDVQDGFDSMLQDFQKETAGVYVKASTLGSLEALLSFLQDMKIPVFEVGIGEVHKKDVKRTLIMKEKGPSTRLFWPLTSRLVLWPGRATIRGQNMWFIVM